MDMKVIIQLLLVFATVCTLFQTQNAETDCDAEKSLVMKDCEASIRKVGDYETPSHSCCLHVKRSDMTCVCRTLTIFDEKIVCPKKLVRVARECGNPVRVGERCGSKYLL